jgi:HEAT repeat protein
MDATIRLLSHALISLLTAALLFGGAAPAVAQTSGDPIEKLRQTLNTVENLADRDQETKASLAELHTLSQLRKAAVLREWRHHNANVELAALDQVNRDALAEHFRTRTRQVLKGGEAGSILATLDMLSETATTLRAVGEAPTFTLPLTADVARLVGETDPAVRVAAARTLGRIDPDTTIALPVLIELAKAKEPERRADASAALGEILQAIAQPWTAQMINPALLTNRGVTAESAAKLLPLAGASALDPNLDVRRRSLTTLALAATLLERLTPPVQSEPRDPNEVRPLAQALQDQLKAVARCLSGSETDVKMLALKVLEETGLARRRWLEQVTAATLPGDKIDDPLAAGLGDALPALADTLVDDNVKVRRATLDVLEIYGPLASAAAPATALALKDPDRYVRWAAVRTLGAIGMAARPAIPALTKLLDDPDLDLRQTVAAVLQTLDASGIGSPKNPGQSALTALIRALDQDSAEMRLSALHALAAMGVHATPAIPKMALAVRDADPRVRLAAVQALGAVGPAAKTVVETLRLALKDDHVEVRKAAGDALLKLEREP